MASFLFENVPLKERNDLGNALGLLFLSGQLGLDTTEQLPSPSRKWARESAKKENTFTRVPFTFVYSHFFSLSFFFLFLFIFGLKLYLLEDDSENCRSPLRDVSICKGGGRDSFFQFCIRAALNKGRQ
ncbi:hypothetical protein TNCV_1111991 [Trichonephila clavipes]|uniref:Uncharacterized protein n=1 Tax=Trichonephila clavipes TaxID=2585209 RepID=A0A8X6RGS5_TRICX|nr:hypothetical protein TNCV_1111991 [Trichonephila clavipes]